MRCIISIWLILTLFIQLSFGKHNLSEEAERLKALTQLKPSKQYVMFWRPQKVGSSTLLSVLLSYGFRYHLFPRARGRLTNFCHKILSCASDNPYNNLSGYDKIALLREIAPYRRAITQEQESKHQYSMIESISYAMSVNHELCSSHHDIIYKNLNCAFESRMDVPYDFHKSDTYTVQIPVSEIFIVRDPLSRYISTYYFWGEIAKIRSFKTRKGGARMRDASIRIGMADEGSILVSVNRKTYQYHGNESSSPPADVALAYAKVFPLNHGMPGPSYTFSAFSDNPRDAVTIIQSDRMMTVVTERLDESLVVLSHYLQWSLADVVITAHRKSLSSHPKAADWPVAAVELMRTNLEASGEMDVYRSAIVALDSRIEHLKVTGIKFDDEVSLLRQLRTRATEICMTESSLQKYKLYLDNQNMSKHQSNNKLRDAEDKFANDGHLFSLNGEILYSYDVCGSCEAHAILYALKHSLAESVDTSPSLVELSQQQRQGNVDFINCP